MWTVIDMKTGKVVCKKDWIEDCVEFMSQKEDIARFHIAYEV